MFYFFRITIVVALYKFLYCLFIQLTSFARKNSNKASSLSNVDSVVGCSLKLFGSLARDFFATLPKVNMKVEISELQPGILLFVMNIATGFVISCGEVFQCSQPSSLLQR